ncbi:acyltransferase [Legionella tucsonensis]|uniref:Chloramphenicol acetyltransferase n=1 Tax=Legionella tucsonensis TaxID=40335 RepID=A0A0W0ZTK2_9GAMM|nr:acyltransferase [Legionella tucsonensis]KTD72246.1 chloramphenicol acetyltransferase [Legionella tucsonensis]
MKRLLKLFYMPFNWLHAILWPVSYAKKIGVNINGKVAIYGSSHGMFSSEPYLVTLGDNVIIAIGAKFICHDGPVDLFRNRIPDLELAGEIIVGNNVFIGTGALILYDVKIGDNCIIGANAIITKDVPSGSVVAGSPARVIGTTEAFLEKAQLKSLKIGHLKGKEKVAAYKKIFNKF